MSSLIDPGSGAATANVASSDALSMETQLTRKDELKPVDNMHHFMEYIFEPVYGELNQSLKTPPTDKAGWAKLKSSSLILAETSILLADRPPEKKDGKVWKESSSVVYKGGASLYQAARKKDFDGVKKHFAAMTEGCKKCHETYR